MIARTMNALTTMSCIFSACRNGNSTYSFGHVQFDYRHSGILILLPTGILEGMVVLRMYYFIQFASCDLTLCLLALRRSQETDWPRYSGRDPAFFGHELGTEQVFDASPMHAHKRSGMGSVTIVDVPGHNIQWLCKM